MNILFEFSRSGLPKNKKYYEAIRDEIIQRGHTLTNDLLKEGDSRKRLPEGLHQRLTKSISSADGVVIEGSVVSLSLGYVLTKSINLGKPVLFLINKKQYSKKNRFVSSIRSKFLIQKDYQTNKELRKALDGFFKNNKNLRTRFNLVLPNELNSYLKSASRISGKSITGYLVDLIKTDKNKRRT